jgi:hypothetical protein
MRTNQLVLHYAIIAALGLLLAHRAAAQTFTTVGEEAAGDFLTPARGIDCAYVLEISALITSA